MYFIKITDKIKVKAPISDITYYDGPLIGIDLRQQKTNYENIVKTLEPYNIKLNYIWFGVFDVNRYNFIVKSECGRVFWRKYEGRKQGSGQNYIYIDGKKCKTTKWLSMDKEDRDKYIYN